MSSAHAELVALARLRSVEPEWRDLCARSIVDNPFAEPNFLLPLLGYAAPRRPLFALARSAEGRLIGLAALAPPPLGVGLARAWTSPYAALPAMVFDRDAARDALAALLAVLAARTRLAGLILPVEAGGPLAVALAAAADTAALPRAVAARRGRAALRLGGGVADFEAALDPKRRKRWERQARRLETQGRVAARADADAVEAFFEVERGGWKGQRRTALADEPSRLAFAREALGRFAAEGRLEALRLTLDDRAIAAGLALIAGRRAFYWKTAYDEAHAAASPGVQLTLAHSRRLAARGDLELVDSCADEDHPMIGRVWSDSLAFEDIAVGLRPGAGRALAFWLASERARLRARAAVKRAVTGARR